MPNIVVPALRKCTKKLLIARILIIIMIFTNLTFIWYNSAKVSKESDKVSKTIAQDVAEKVVEDYEKLPKPSQKNHVNRINVKLRSLGHFAEFIPLGLLFFLFMASLLRPNREKVILSLLLWVAFSVILSAFGALTDEIHQIFVKGRTFQLIDIFMDTLGATVGCVIALIPTYTFKNKWL